VTSTAPGAHPPPEEVDALLDPSGGDAHVGAHVAACERCRQVRDGLREVRELLGRQARELPPEPPDLGARIAAALAAEPPLRAPGRETLSTKARSTSTGRAHESTRGATVTPLAPRRRRATTWLAVAASVAVVGLGGTFLATRAVDSTSSEAGAAAEQAPGAQEDTSGGGDTDAGGDGVTTTDQGAGGAVAPTTAGGRSTAVALSSGTDYRAGTLAGQAQVLLQLAQRGGDGLSEKPAGPEGAPLLSGRGVDRCLSAVGRSGAEALATDLATFEGEPAAVIVLTRGSDREAVVVPQACGAGDDRVLASASLD
jgi:hypothetical protein